MYAANTVHVQAPWERMFTLAADVARWPALLPHYRHVRVLRQRGAHTWLDMAARRDLIPVRWQAVQGVYPAARLITYQHVGGLTRGMRVVWQLVPDADGVAVTIRHTFTPGWPLVGGWPTQAIVGHFFVEYIAGLTLRHLKAHAEGTPLRSPASDGRAPDQPPWAAHASPTEQAAAPLTSR